MHSRGLFGYPYALLRSIVEAATIMETMPTTSSKLLFMLSMKMNAGFPIKVIIPSANIKAANTTKITPATKPPTLIPAAFKPTLPPPNNFLGTPSLHNCLHLATRPSVDSRLLSWRISRTEQLARAILIPNKLLNAACI